MQHKNGPLLRSRSNKKRFDSRGYGWLGNLDSNQDKQSQSLLCYRYTIPQELLNGINSLAGWPGQSLAGGDANHRLAGAPFYSLGQGLGKKVWRAVLGENVGRSTRPR
jgi:hypothetical protein